MLIICEIFVFALHFRIHPFTVMIALLAYEARKAKKGTMTWKINPAIVDALLVTLQYSIDVCISA